MSPLRGLGNFHSNKCYNNVSLSGLGASPLDSPFNQLQFLDMDRAYGTQGTEGVSFGQRVKTHCYKMGRAYGSGYNPLLTKREHS